MYPPLRNNEPSDSPTRVFIADKYALIRDCLCLIVQSQPDMCMVGASAIGKAYPETICTVQPDVILMGISLPDSQDREFITCLLAHHPRLKVIVIAAYEDHSFFLKLLEAGVCGYVRMQSSAEELLRAIRGVVAGQTYIDTALTNRLLSALTHGKSNFAAGQKLDPLLSGREREVLSLYTLGYTNKEIAVLLKISEKTVETYKLRSMQKLNLDGRVEAIKYALRQGWLQSSVIPCGCDTDLA